VVGQRLGQLLDGLVEVLGLEVLHLQQVQQPFVTFQVLVDPVLDLLLVDGVPADEGGVHVLLLSLGVGDQDGGQGRAHRRTVLGLVAQEVQEILEQPVVGEDQVDDVAAAGPGISIPVTVGVWHMACARAGRPVAGGR
jgi:hypothetical protein